MMPISLTLSAFGPYPDTITIDFESFQEDGIRRMFDSLGTVL